MIRSLASLSTALVSASLFSLPAARAQLITAFTPKEIRWQRFDANGGKYAVLEGDPKGAGVFTYAYQMPDGAWFAPHMHSQAARVFVVRGTLLIGEGSSEDHTKARVLPAGTFFIVPKDSPHWEGARGETLIIGVANGPWSTRFLQPSAAVPR